jgi:hypothetical protein
MPTQPAALAAWISSSVARFFGAPGQTPDETGDCFLGQRGSKQALIVRQKIELDPVATFNATVLQHAFRQDDSAE